MKPRDMWRITTQSISADRDRKAAAAEDYGGRYTDSTSRVILLRNKKTLCAKEKKKDLTTLQKFSRQSGYIDCMAAESNEKMMLNWFEKMTLKELQNQQKTGNIKRILQLEAVKQALSYCFQNISGYENVEICFDLDTHRIMIEYMDRDEERWESIRKRYNREKTADTILRNCDCMAGEAAESTVREIINLADKLVCGVPD